MYRVHRQLQQHGGAVVHEQRRRILSSKLHSRPPDCKLYPLPDVHSHLDFTTRPTSHNALRCSFEELLEWIIMLKGFIHLDNVVVPQCAGTRELRFHICAWSLWYERSIHQQRQAKSFYRSSHKPSIAQASVPFVFFPSNHRVWRPDSPNSFTIIRSEIPSHFHTNEEIPISHLVLKPVTLNCDRTVMTEGRACLPPNRCNNSILVCCVRSCECVQK